MELLRDQEIDSLGTLEERIQQAVELVVRLRRERDAAAAERDAAIREHGAAQRLRAERKHVRNRIEKLLGQIDALSTV
jgi:FtsZ-binding cell division protein ZapB